MIPLALGALNWRAIGLTVGAVALVGGIAWGVAAIYQEGKASGMLTGQLELERAVAASERSRMETLGRLSAAAAENARIQREADARAAAALAKGKMQAKAVERAVRENPSFASVVRPPDLRRVRDEQLADIAAEAIRSSELSGRGIFAVPASGPR